MRRKQIRKKDVNLNLLSGITHPLSFILIGIRFNYIQFRASKKSGLAAKSLTCNKEEREKEKVKDLSRQSYSMIKN
jgi:hypothetical protein